MYPTIILSGGKSSRLGRLTAKQPKCMLMIDDKPFVLHQLNLLEARGVKSVTLCLDYLSNKVTEYLDKKYTGNLNISFSFDGHAPLGTGGAVKKASIKIKTPFFVMYGDSYLDISFKEVAVSYAIKEGPLMVIFKNNGLFDRSNVHLTNRGIVYNKSNPNSQSRYIDYGLGIFEGNHLSTFENTFDLSLVYEQYSKQKALQYFLATKRFYEIGSHQGFKEAMVELPKKFNKNT